uniref:Uncharacterized protein n=1 Tax=Erpetoichthys calabaricus TaxID=27687 RepID=A0A8C4X775_ERPCA
MNSTRLSRFLIMHSLPRVPDGVVVQILKSENKSFFYLYHITLLWLPKNPILGRKLFRKRGNPSECFWKYCV